MDQQIGNELPPLHNPEQGPQAPQNSFEALAVPAQTEAQQGRNIESGISQPPQLPPLPSQPPVSGISTTATQAPLTTGAPSIADDTDLIEKEWVVKAKEIVERTKHDPYQQNKDVERIKADYLKKRFNKDVKVAED